MKNEILAKLRNILAKLYPDEASMRRISHDAGIDLARVTLNSSPTNNWHSILNEAENVGRIEALLTVILQEYGSNQALLDAYEAYRQIASHSTQNADQRPTLNTGGGAAVGNNVQTGGDFIGRDQINFIVPLGSWEEVRRLLFKGQGDASAVKTLQEQFQSFDWSKAEQAYLDKVINLYDRVRIFGSSSDVPLGNIFTQVYILDKPTARYRYDIEELRKRGHERADFQRQPGERIHGLDLVKKGQNLFILGKPGAGKTTFLKYITIQAARKQLPRIPIFVSLNQWADSRWGKGEKGALLPFLVEQFDICNFPDADLFINYLLQTGRALVLFDGLDEVKQEKDQRRYLIKLLQDFARKYNYTQHLITCRIAASDYVFEGFADVEVADFTAERVREYARLWFNEHDKKFYAFISELKKQENKGLAELCNTPLLLSLLCLIFDNSMRFPPSRAELYEEALETLLRKWDSSRQIQRDEIYRSLSYKRKLQLFMSIAVPTFEKGELFFRQRDLESWIIDYLATLPGTPPKDTLDSTAILKAMEAQHGILVERAQGIYSFSHLTFQEYLTARSLVENQGNKVTYNLICNHLTDQRWREVFLLTATLLADADNFVGILHKATEGIVAGTPNLIQLLNWAYERTQQAHAPLELYPISQLAYIFLLFLIERDQKLVLVISTGRDLAREIANVRTLVHDLALDRVLVLDRTLDRVRTQALDRVRTQSHPAVLESAGVFEAVRELALSLATTIKSAHSVTPLVGFDYGLYYAWVCSTLFGNERLDRTDIAWQTAMSALFSLMKDVVSLSVEAGHVDLGQILLGHPTPSPDARAQEWQHYADVLLNFLQTQRDLGQEWNFSYEEIRQIRDYFYANELLVQCLNIAAISDRPSELQRLLLPPATKQKDKKIQGIQSS